MCHIPHIDFLDRNHLGTSLMNFAQDLDMKFLDNKLPHGRGITFKCDTTGAMSAIDHFAVSESLYPSVCEVRVIDSGINLSDHCQLVIEIAIPVARKWANRKPPKQDHIS